MLYKYFRFTKKRILTFVLISGVILLLQAVLTGNLLARQRVVTEAGNAESAVIGILDSTELVRQKFKFDRRVVLEEFTLSFGSFDRSDVGDNLDIQMTDGENNILYETAVPVDDISPNGAFRVPMNYTVTIPKGAVCCIKLSCSSPGQQYATVPTLNTTNRTDPNTYLSTLEMQTRKKCLNISYTYTYRQFLPMFTIILEFGLLFFLCFERITEYGELLRKRQEKENRRKEKARLLEESAKEKRGGKNQPAKVRYGARQGKEGKKDRKKYSRRKQKKQNPNQLDKNKKEWTFKGFVKWCLVEPKVIQGIRIGVVVLNPLLIFFAIALMNQTLATMKPAVWFFSWLLILALQWVAFAVVGRMSSAILIVNAILFPAGLANLVLMDVRGTPLLPADMLALNTAAEVAQTYSISLTPAQFVMLPAFILWCFLVFRVRKKGKIRPSKALLPARAWEAWARRGASLIAGVAAICLMYQTPVLENCGIVDNVWNKVASSRSNGFYMNFFINLHYLSIKKPDGYTEDSVEEILAELKEKGELVPSPAARKNTEGARFLGNSDFGSNTSLGGKQPNIILIMNESLADYDQIGNTNFNRDPLAYMHNLRENTIYGRDYVSIYGAGTSNSEFEAMTGNTMKFFPSGCNVYQQFMHDSTFSMAYYLKSLGYATAAIHPSSGANWNRINTYESMRFDRFATIEDFKNPEYVRYISDKESYKKVIELYEAKEKDKPIFLFDMTIQNHGGYLTNTNWKNPVYVKGAYYEEAKEFLSSTKVSDDAFRYLLSYFSKQEEPTVICMFGDHQPSIETAFYEELLGKKQRDWDLTDIQKRYVAPFIIWANYDIDEAQDVVISNNYLENLLLKQAGIALPLYNQYVEEVSKELPAMNVNGYMDNSGVWHSYGSDEGDNVKKLLTDYELLQYGYYSDSDKSKMCRLFEMAE